MTFQSYVYEVKKSFSKYNYKEPDIDNYFNSSATKTLLAKKFRDYTESDDNDVRNSANPNAVAYCLDMLY